MKSFRFGLACGLALFLAACGGGGGGGSSPPPPPVAPSGLSYPAAPSLNVNTAITPLSPTVTGSVTLYAVSPALPAGLALNAGSGIISGTPTAISAAAGYLVTASNSAGNTTATISLTVNAAVPAVSYGATTHTFTTGVAVNLVPNSTGGAVVTWAIDRTLPTGLAFNTTTGAISGTPTVLAGASNYVITASNSGGNAPVTLTLTVNAPAPVVSYGGTAFTFVDSTAVNLVPASTGGAVVSWSVDRPLPAPLQLNPSTGVISGSPFAPTPASNYVITASNSGGTASVTLTITVVGRTPVITYSGVTYTFTTGVPVDLIAQSTGGAVLTWAINPALPAGLSFDANTGRITGTPTQAVARATYVVTATNTGGTDTVNLSIAVAAPGPDTGVLLNLGHTTGGFAILHDGSRILSGDVESVVLSDAQTGAIIASTSIDCDYPGFCSWETMRTALHGPTAVIRHPTSFEVWSSVDGSVLASIPWPTSAVTWWRLATDGSYLVAGNSTELRVWSPTGTVLFSRSGNQTAVKVFAAPGELRIASGPAGASVIEKVALPAGTSTVTPTFSGTFHSWFMDGENFFSNTGNTVWVYSHGATQRDLDALSTLNGLAGQGDWLWIRSSGPPTLQIYRVGAGTTPAASYAVSSSTLFVPSTGTIFFAPTSGTENDQLSIIDLSGATPVRRDYTAPLPYIRGFGSASASDWAFTNNLGVMYGELGGPTPTLYSLGAARSIAGSDSRFAVATASGRIFYFDANTRQLQDEIEFVSGKIRMSADGNLLAASAEYTYAQYRTDRTLKVFSLPSETVAAEWAHSFGGNLLLDFTFSRSGNMVGRVARMTGANTTGYVTQLNGTPVWTHVGEPPSGIFPPIQISPNGTLIALADGDAAEPTASNVYLNGTLSSVASGYAIGWVDDNRLLLNRYSTPRSPLLPRYEGADLVNASGQIITSLLPLPELFEIQAISGNRIYSPDTNEVYDLTTGERTWSSQAPKQFDNAGAVAGSNVIFTSKATVRIEPL